MKHGLFSARAGGIDGRVDPNGPTWQKLVALSRRHRLDPLELPIAGAIDFMAIDARVLNDVPLRANFDEILDNPIDGEKVIICSTFNEMVNKIVSSSQESRIGSILVLGHGGPGYQLLGCGPGPPGTRKQVLMLGRTAKPGVEPANELIGDMSGILGQLKGRFQQGVRVTLLGCNVAKGPDGPDMLKKVSEALVSCL